MYGRWQCPECGCEWTGSIGWNLNVADIELVEERIILCCPNGCGQSIATAEVLLQHKDWMSTSVVKIHKRGVK